MDVTCEFPLLGIALVEIRGWDGGFHVLEEGGVDFGDWCVWGDGVLEGVVAAPFVEA